MYYLVKDTMGSKLVLIGQHPKKKDAIKRKELEEISKYSFETFWVCNEKEYADLLMLYV